MNETKVFVIMPFDVEFDDLYSHIKNMMEDEGFQVFRADDLLNQENILKDVVLSIYNSDVIIADLTGLNPNVFYELGLAHAFRRNVILLTQEIEELPFDLRSYRVIQYSTHFAKIRELEDTLRRMCEEIKQGRMSFGSPVRDWVPIEKQKRQAKQAKQAIIEIVGLEDGSKKVAKDEEIDENKGFIDYFADMEDSMESLTSLVCKFSENTEQVGEEVREITEQIQKAWERPTSGAASHVRKLARKLATKMNDYGLGVSKQNKEYERQWNKFEDSTANLILSPIVYTDHDSLEGLSKFLDSMDSVKEGIISARDGISAMAEAVISVKGFESSVTRAAMLIEREIKTFVGLLDKSISTLDRVILIGKEQLQKYNCDLGELNG